MSFLFLGWNGKHCTLSGCPGNCNGHGQCKTNHYMEWECWCDSGWFGEGCDVYMEKDCSDRKDNDDGERERERERERHTHKHTHTRIEFIN